MEAFGDTRVKGTLSEFMDDKEVISNISYGLFDTIFGDINWLPSLEGYLRFEILVPVSIFIGDFNKNSFLAKNSF